MLSDEYFQLEDKLQGVGLNTNWTRASALSTIYITSLVWPYASVKPNAKGVEFDSQHE